MTGPATREPFQWELDSKRARRWAKANGYYGRAGGWIYRKNAQGDEVAVCQGYASLFRRKHATIVLWEQQQRNAITVACLAAAL